MTQLVRTRQELLESLAQTDRGYSALLQNFSSEQLNWVPAPGVWSMAQCIDHVGRVNCLYLPIIHDRISRAQPLSNLADRSLRTAGWPSNLFLESVSPEGKRRVKVPAAGRPDSSPSINSEEPLQTLLETHTRIRELLNASRQPDLNRIRFKNPFFPLLRFTVATGILVMITHARRHLQQAERVALMDHFPRAGASKSA